MTGRIGTLAFVVAALAVASPASAGADPRLSCPAHAPDGWGPVRGPLAGVEVLAAPRGAKIDNAAPPSLVPDVNEVRDGILHQAWRMNAEGPNWVYYVDCHFAGTTRVLRLDAGSVARCERVLPAPPKVDLPQSLTCD